MSCACIVAFSTSTERGSVAVRAADGEIIEVSYLDLHAHAERILCCLEDAMLQAGRTRAELEAVATDVGPGSFTGVRVAIATAKGIATALGLPIFGVCSLQAMAASSSEKHSSERREGIVVPVIDARKGEWFVGAYRTPNLDQIATPVHLAPEMVPRWRESLGFDGPTSTMIGLPASAEDPGVAYPSAAGVLIVAARRFGAGERPEPSAIDAIYVREPDAKLPQRALGVPQTG